jgi:hypothetical protein
LEHPKNKIGTDIGNTTENLQLLHNPAATRDNPHLHPHNNIRVRNSPKYIHSHTPSMLAHHPHRIRSPHILEILIHLHQRGEAEVKRYTADIPRKEIELERIWNKKTRWIHYKNA